MDLFVSEVLGGRLQKSRRKLRGGEGEGGEQQGRGGTRRQRASSERGVFTTEMKKSQGIEKKRG